MIVMGGRGGEEKKKESAFNCMQVGIGLKL